MHIFYVVILYVTGEIVIKFYMIRVRLSLTLGFIEIFGT